MLFEDLDLTKKFTYADYVGWKFTEAVELIKGRVFKMAAPLSNHQKVAGNLFRMIDVYLYRKKCNTYIAPFDVRLIKSLTERKSDADIETVLQPDICVVCDLNKIDRRGCLGAPDLIIEILSKSTASKDVKDKFEVYEESGVKEYWMVSIEEETVLVYRLDNHNRFVAEQRPCVSGDNIKVGIFDDFSIPVEEIFLGIIDFKD